MLSSGMIDALAIALVLIVVFSVDVAIHAWERHGRKHRH